MVMSKLSKWLMSRDCLSNHSNFISWNNVSSSLKSTEFKQIWFVAYLWCFRELNGEKVLLVRREEEMLRDGLPPSSTSSTFNCGMICPPTVHAIPRDCVREGVSIVPWEVQLWTRWGRDGTWCLWVGTWAGLRGLRNERWNDSRYFISSRDCLSYLVANHDRL